MNNSTTTNLQRIRVLRDAVETIRVKVTTLRARRNADDSRAIIALYLEAVALDSEAKCLAHSLDEHREACACGHAVPAPPLGLDYQTVRTARRRGQRKAGDPSRTAVRTATY